MRWGTGFQAMMCGGKKFFGKTARGKVYFPGRGF